MAAKPTQEELAMALFQKKNMTGRAFNAYLTTTEGGRYLAAEGRPGFNSQYVEGLGSLFATIHEKGIDLKRGGARGILDIDLAQILSGNQITPTERENQLLKLGEATGAFDEYFADTTRAQKRQVVRDAISAFERAGSAGSSAHKRYLAVTGMQGSSLAEAITLMSGRMHRAPGGLIDQYMVAGHFTQSPMTEEVSNQLGSINANTARSAFVEGAQRLESGFKEYAAGLKEGKGWGALAIGAAVLAGVGLGMQKPGRMNVTMNQGDETEAPIISPRNERAIQLLSEQQHQARIMIQNAQKVDRSTFIQLGDAISGKYNVPGRTKIHLRDDRDQTDYSVIFRDEFRRQMAGIS